MSDYERTILEFYQLPTAYPSEWPAEKDDDSSGDEADPKKHGRQKSRYQALESSGDGKGAAVGRKGGVNNMVLKDEPDPLGTTDSVVRSLRENGLQVQDDVRLRNRFMLSSTTFSPALFLSQIHARADTRTLLEGLDILSQSIDQKSASLKVLVESNFERFVKAKATIDNVYREMKYRGAESGPGARGSVHGRHASRTSLRGGKGGLNSPMAMSSDSRKKNALIKESEYGVLGIKAPLLDVSAKAEDVWGPALGGREKEEHLKDFQKYVNKFKDPLELSTIISDCIKRKDYETLVEAYNRARQFADDARALSNRLGSQSPEDEELYQLMVAARVWYDVDRQIQAFKREVWKRLVSLHTLSKSESHGGRGLDQYMDVITLLLELGVGDNPIWVWLLSRYDFLKSKIQSTADHTKAEIEVLRRRLAANEKPSSRVIASHLRTLGRQSMDGKPTSSDSADVIELWEKMLAFLTSLISPQGILGELLEFWETAQGFIEGRIQKTLPTGYNDESQKHHQLTQNNITDLEKGIVELVDLLRGHVYEFFAGLPPEDISMVFSPLPLSPNSPASANGFGHSLSPTSRDPRFNFDPNNPPPSSPKKGEPWEKLAFWPPWSNSISGVYYLCKMLALVGSGASDLATIDPIRSGNGQVLEQLKALIGVSRERCVTALCTAWNKDAENMKFIEDWQPSAESGDVTRMPASFAVFEGALLTGMQKILYISEAMSKPNAGDIVLPPPAKLLQMVRSQYVTTLYKALSGMVENAERSVKKAEDEWSIGQEGGVSAVAVSSVGKSTLDAGDRNVRMLLTLSNLQALRSQIVPNLNSQFENAFSVKLTDESKTIKDVLGQIDARLFQSYTKQATEKLREIILAGLEDPDWAPASGHRPQTAKPYVYETLLTLVLVHSQVSTTAASLTPQVLSFLLEQTSLQLLDAFRKRSRYSLSALIQATLDVEFIAQTLSQYTTDKASELQGQIYQELDSRTDNDARARLQNELPEMRNVLKKLRDASKNEFACFKKPRRTAGQGSSRVDSGSMSPT
ncbi:exocyst complex component SEC5 [Trichoderma asperellum]|uniref:Exocyst complex component SEC5 n=1 Tax=Trichoderma asperellum TaxID=101201 RepID=A0A6V8QMA3_TRIAP|nr:exocyst complex component Sec5-domain-containing protein [Trichoderma asperelloides]GFP53525.1 exocyst complex component SEC5 [Trichoderma asperellum]